MKKNWLMCSHLARRITFSLISTGTIPVNTQKKDKKKEMHGISHALFPQFTPGEWPSPHPKPTLERNLGRRYLPWHVPHASNLFWKTRQKKKKSREAPFHMDQMPDCFHGAAILIASPLHHSFPVSPFHKQMENEKNSQVQLDSTRAY